LPAAKGSLLLNTNRLTGVLLWALAAGVIILNVLLNIAVEDGFVDNGRNEIAESLADVHDDKDLWGVANVFDILVVNVLAILVGIALYLYFRNRRGGSVSWPVKSVAATLGLVGILISTVLFTVSDVANLTLIDLALDYEERGVEGVEAGDPQTAELARTISTLGGLSTVAGLSFLGFGLIGFGLAIARASKVEPADGQEDDIPQWLGWIAIIAGALLLTNWLGVTSDSLFVSGLLGLAAGLLWLIVLGWWFLFKAPSPQNPEPSAQAA
jgi:hypothetical protein